MDGDNRSAYVCSKRKTCLVSDYINQLLLPGTEMVCFYSQALPQLSILGILYFPESLLSSGY